MSDSSIPPSQQPAWPYWLLRRVLFGLFRLLARLEVENLERLPEEGPYIIAINHIHLFDGPLAFAVLGRRHVTAFVGVRHRAGLLGRFVGRWSNIIWIRRGQVDKRSFRAGLAALEQGLGFGLAPEGTRSPTGQLIAGQEGVALLAYRSKAPVYPMAIIGTPEIFRSLKRLRRARVQVVVGEPINLAEIVIENRSERLKVWTDEIMCQLAALLPVELRGVYGDHPRLRALLGEG